MELDTDDSSLAIGRIESALTRVEQMLAERASRPAKAPATAAPDSSLLASEVKAVIGALDQLIAEASRG